MVKSLPLIVGYSGLKGDTPTRQNGGRKMKIFPSILPPPFDISTACVEEGRKALIGGDFTRFGEMMNINEGLLSAYGVEIGRLAAMTHAARDAGAYGAKLSGAGGGDCMIAVAPNHKTLTVKKQLQMQAGKY